MSFSPSEASLRARAAAKAAEKLQAPCGNFRWAKCLESIETNVSLNKELGPQQLDPLPIYIHTSHTGDLNQISGSVSVSGGTLSVGGNKTTQQPDKKRRRLDDKEEDEKKPASDKPASKKEPASTDEKSESKASLEELEDLDAGRDEKKPASTGEKESSSHAEELAAAIVKEMRRVAGPTLCILQSQVDAAQAFSGQSAEDRTKKAYVDEMAPIIERYADKRCRLCAVDECDIRYWSLKKKINYLVDEDHLMRTEMKDILHSFRNMWNSGKHGKQIIDEDLKTISFRFNSFLVQSGIEAEVAHEEIARPLNTIIQRQNRQIRELKEENQQKDALLQQKNRDLRAQSYEIQQLKWKQASSPPPVALPYGYGGGGGGGGSGSGGDRGDYSRNDPYRGPPRSWGGYGGRPSV